MLSLKRMLAIRSYKTVWTMGHKIRKAMADRDAHYKLAGLVEMDDSYFGGSKPGKEGRGALGKGKVIVSVEDRGRRAGFAKMSKVDSMSSNNISRTAGDHLTDNSKVKTDGWRAYRSALKEQNVEHEYVVVGSGKEAPKLLPWVHTMLANIKGNIRGVYRGVSNKHLQRYLDEFCYRFNRRFWEDQLFGRVLCACLNTPTITYSELKAWAFFEKLLDAPCGEQNGETTPLDSRCLSCLFRLQWPNRRATPRLVGPSHCICFMPDRYLADCVHGHLLWAQEVCAERAIASSREPGMKPPRRVFRP